MTVSLEQVKTTQQMEYILCIEGMGWANSTGGVVTGFDGNVFVTADIAGGLAAILGCTIHKTLVPQSSIESSLDPVSCTVTPGRMAFDVIDDGYLLTTFTPYRAPYTDTIATAIAYMDTDIYMASGTFVAGDVVWLGHSEAILLGVKTHPADYRFTACTRGYLGTLRGRSDTRNYGAGSQSWPVGAIATSVTKIWAGRNMRLYAHVPGEVVGNCQLMWQGKFNVPSMPNLSGVSWKLSGTGSLLLFGNHMRSSARMYLSNNSFSSADGKVCSYTYRTDDGNTAVPDWAAKNTRRNLHINNSKPASGYAYDNALIDMASARAVEELFQYRTEPGGADGLNANFPWSDLAHIQAPDKTYTTNISAALVSVGDAIVRIINAGTNPHNFIAETTSDWAGQYSLQLFTNGVPIRLLLDNFSDDYEVSRFAINRVVGRNPIDVALIFLTSCNSEFWRGDATGGTAAVPTFAAVLVADAWIGYALHCVEGANKGYCRVITDNAAASITVDPAFPAAPAAGDEYQIRNTIYDVLPITWGIGIHHDNLDVVAFEAIRDKHLSDTSLAKFAIGFEDEQDLWGMVLGQILAPYLVAIHINKTSGKLEPIFVGDALGDGIDGAYVAVGINDIIDIGALDYGSDNPISAVELLVRDVFLATVSVVRTTGRSGYKHAGSRFWEKIDATQGQVSSIDPTSGKMATIEVVEQNQTDAHLTLAKNIVKVSSPFNTIDDAGTLIALWTGVLKLRMAARPRTTMRLSINLWPYVSEGTLLSITYPDYPVNPFTGARGWTGLVARVLGMSLPLSGDSLEFTATVELLDDLNAGLVAPAAMITAKDWAAHPHHVHVRDNEMTVAGNNDKDWWHFVVGDNVAIYHADGSLAANVGTVASFGVAEVADPTTASSQVNFTTEYAVYDIIAAVGNADGVNAYSVVSADGSAWAETANPKNTALLSVAYGSSLFVAVGVADGADAYMVSAADGATWAEMANPKNKNLLGVAHHNGFWVAVGENDGVDAYIVTSPNGAAPWTERTNPKNVYLYKVVWGVDKWVAVGEVDGTDAYIVTSANGITWTERANPKNKFLLSVAFGGGMFVAAGQNDGVDSYLITSPDGVVWTERANPKNFISRAVAHHDGLWVIVGSADGTDPYIITSPDGVVWTERAPTVAKNLNLYAICWCNGQWIAVGQANGVNAYCLTSPDGIVWTEQVNPKNFDLYGIAAKPAIVEGDYIGFQSWQAAQPVRMDDYGGIADAATRLLDGVDTAKDFT